jgi:predicted dithiol-disulfide oxidoreductase (DUF899 family)
MPVRPLANESPEYRKRRSELLEAELALQAQRERVAALRRSLPLDTTIADASFEEIRDGVRRPVRLSELFEQPDHTLVLMHFMYGKKQQAPCPMCTLWADGYDGIVPHLRQRVSFAVLVAGDAGDFSAYARSRGWRYLRVVSAADSDLKRQLGFEDEEGAQFPGVSVFRRRDDGSLVHVHSVSAMPAPGQFRGMDLLSPFWHFLDLTPEGRGDFMPRRSYERSA